MHLRIKSKQTIGFKSRPAVSRAAFLIPILTGGIFYFSNSNLLMRSSIILLLLLLGNPSFSQSYTSYMTGDSSDVTTIPAGGICLMGGATESDQACRWFLQRANGGNVVVIRASGSDGYNDYFYSGLGVSVHSVQSIVFNDASAAADPYVRGKIANAEAIWIAGGDQSMYVTYWKGTGIDSILNYLVNVKHVPIGGTSAGMAILGEAYNSAMVGSVTSAAALSNPFDPEVTVGDNDFLHLPFLRNTVTDTHYDNPDRRGRHVVFLSRMMSGSGDTARGIACDEYTAVCVGTDGIGHVYGNYPTDDDNAYFLQVNCTSPNNPETLLSGTPLTWDRGNAAIKAYHTHGDTSGTQTFDLNDWKTGSGGVWENWWVSSGVLNTAAGTVPGCPAGIEDQSVQLFTLYPSPAYGNSLYLDTKENGLLSIYNTDGKLVQSRSAEAGINSIPVGGLPSGVYLIVYSSNTGKPGKAIFLRP